MKVRIRQDTHHEDYGHLRPRTVHEMDDATADRLIRLGIANPAEAEEEPEAQDAAADADDDGDPLEGVADVENPFGHAITREGAAGLTGENRPAERRPARRR